MRGIYSRRSTTDDPLEGNVSNVGGHGGQESVGCQAPECSSKTVADLTPPTAEDIVERQPQKPVSFSERTISASGNRNSTDIEAEELQSNNAVSHKSVSNESKLADAAKRSTAKVPEVASLFGRAGTDGLGKAVELLDTHGNSMTSLQINNLSVSGSTKNKISILTFEVANTIVKGSNLLHSLSKENIKHLKEVVLPSDVVQFLVSRDMDELLRISASDKREELKVFLRGVVHFGNRCKDPQWHNLDRYFDRMDSEHAPQSQSKEEIDLVMQQLMTLVQYTAELYHEFQALDKFEQDYQHKLEEGLSNAVQKGESLSMLRAELKSQRKLVKSLKKRSLWSKNLDKVMEKLVCIVDFVHVEICHVFGSADVDITVVSLKNHQRLGSTGLALHYANIISQIDTLVSCSGSVPPNSRDTLYQGLPPSLKSALRPRLLSFIVEDEFAVPRIKAEMERILQWLVPIATNTTKVNHHFGWFGEWVNTGSEANKKQEGQNYLLRIETLHHADKEKVEACILELVVWLHHLISQSRSGADGIIKSTVKSPGQSRTEKITALQLSAQRPASPLSMSTPEDQEMLRDVNFRKLSTVISKIFDTAKTWLSKNTQLSKNSSRFPDSCSKELDDGTSRLPSTLPIDIDRIKALDVIDGVDTLGTLKDIP